MKKFVISFFCVMLVVLMMLGITTPVTVNAAGGILRVGPGQLYLTIQDAVDDAKQGAKILVYPGTYKESVKVQTNNLQIIAQDSGVTVYSPTGLEAAFTVRADHVVIRGFDQLTGTACTPGINFEGSYNTFADNIINPGSCSGINAIMCRDTDGGSNYNRIENNTIVHADIGIEIFAWDALNVGNIIKNNTINLISDLGIGVENGIGFTISGNRIPTSGFNCIWVIASNNVAQGYHHIIDNTVTDSWGEGGIVLQAKNSTRLSHNHIAKNEISDHHSFSGIYLYADPDATLSDNLILDNKVTDNYYNGIFLETGVINNRIFNNYVMNNANNGLLVFGDNNRIFNNYVTTNSADGIVVESDNNNIIGNTAFGNHDWDLIDTGEGNLWRNNEYGSANWE